MFFKRVCDCPGRKCQLFFPIEVYSWILWEPFCLVNPIFLEFSKALFVFLYFEIAYLSKVFFSLPLIKACMVFLASLYSISTTLHVDFWNFLNNLSQAAIFSTISPSNDSFILFFLIVFVFVYSIKTFSG